MLARLILALLLCSSTSVTGQHPRDLVIGRDRFSSIRGAVQQDSLIYIVDRDAEVLVFAVNNGAARPSIGRRGGGPGEFNGVTRIGLRGDTLWAYDYRSRRVSFFMHGRFLSSFTITTVSDLVDAVLPGGILTSESEDWTTIAAGRKNAFNRTYRTRDLAAQTAVLQINVPAEDIVRVYPQSGRDELGGFSGVSPLAASDIARISADGTAFFHVQRSSYTVRRLDPISGQALWTRTYPYQPVPLTPALRNQIVARLADPIVAVPLMRRQYATEAALREAIEKAVPSPRTLPPVTDAIAGTDGRLWIRREFTGAATVAWDVLDRHGELLRTLRLPTDFQGLSAGSGYIWGRERDELDVPSLVRYRL